MAKSYSQIMFDFKAPEGEERKDPVLPGPEFDDPAFEPETLAMEADQEVRDITELSLVQAGPETLSADPPVSPASKSGRGRKSQKTYAAAADLVDVPEDAVLFSKQY